MWSRSAGLCVDVWREAAQVGLTRLPRCFTSVTGRMAHLVPAQPLVQRLVQLRVAGFPAPGVGVQVHVNVSHGGMSERLTVGNRHGSHLTAAEAVRSYASSRRLVREVILVRSPLLARIPLRSVRSTGSSWYRDYLQKHDVRTLWKPVGDRIKLRTLIVSLNKDFQQM